MNGPDDGGNAFPADASTNLFSRGMSLRDYFAAKVLQAILTNSTLDGDMLEFSVDAYKMADAMLEARKS